MAQSLSNPRFQLPVRERPRTRSRVVKRAREGTSDLEKQLLLTLVETTALFALLAHDAHGKGGVFVALVVTLLLTGALFGAMRWYALLDGMVGGQAAVWLAGFVPAHLGKLHVRIYDAWPHVFTRRYVAALWATLVAVALVFA